MNASSIKFPIGESDFESLRQGNYHYVDKSLFIQQIVQDDSKILLFPRPRRFGKTLNLSMLRYFFEKPKAEKEGSVEQRRTLFSGLNIEESQEAWEHFCKYPVIFVTFKDIKANNWNDAHRAIQEVIAQLFEEHRYLLTGSLLSQEQAQAYYDILSKKAEPAQYWRSLFDISKYLYDYHQEKVVILIDEYDTCLHSAYTEGYYEEAITFFRNLLSGAFKDNRYLFKGVVTGILRVGRESLFSGLNNLAVYSLLRPEFATSFGFTEPEVRDLLQKIGHPELLPNIKTWYNGYLFGETYEIYNPWSILHFLASQNKKLEAYWVNTSSNHLIEKILFDSGFSTQAEVETLLQGGSIDKPLEDNLTLRDLTVDSLWSFLLFCGYLKATKQYQKEDFPHVTLTLPNREVKTAFLTLTRSWFQKQLGRSKSAEAFFQALLAGNAEKVEEILAHLMKVSLSYWDVPSETSSSEENKAKPASKKQTKIQTDDKKGMEIRSAPDTKEEEKTDPEAVYHALLLGMLIFLREEYDIRSNPESGYGRSDLMLIPKQKGKPGVVMEFKVVKKGKTPQATLKEAWKQIKEKQYNTELQERGASPIREYAIAFSGKQAFVKSGESL